MYIVCLRYKLCDGVGFLDLSGLIAGVTNLTFVGLLWLILLLKASRIEVQLSWLNE